MMEKRTKSIKVQAEALKDVDDLVYYMCTDTLREDANAKGLIQLAHYFQMKRLFGECADILIDDLSLDTFVETANIFSKYEIEEKGQRVIDFGKRHIEKLQDR